MKTRKPIKYRYIDSLYEYTLDIIFTNDVKRSLKSLYKQWNISEEVHDCEGCTVICQGKEDKYQDISKYALIFDYSKLTNNLIAHEIQHLAAFVLSDRSIDLEGGNDDYENMAWLNGHLHEVVYSIIDKETLPIYNVKLTPTFKKIR